MPPVVLASRTSDTALLTSAGVPVWPVRNPAELAALRRIVTILGGRLNLVECARPNVVSGSEVVVGLGCSVTEDTRLYAHLTARTPVVVDTLAQLEALPAVSVVVTGYEHIDERLMDALYGPTRRSEAPGIIFSYPGDDLRVQVLSRAATKFLSPLEADWRRVDIQPNLHFGASFSRGFSMLGSEASVVQYRSALGLGAGLLTLSTHSDGIDAKLRPDLVLCPVEEPNDGADNRTAPACVMTSTCHRMNTSIAAARDSGRLLSPSDIHARVFVHDVCWGLFPAQDVQAPYWSLVRRIVNELRVAAVLTSWEITERTVETTAALLHDIACGQTLGRALAKHLSSAHARQHGHQMCLVGDPAVRLSMDPHANPLAAAIARATTPTQEDHLENSAHTRDTSACEGDAAGFPFLLRMVDHARSSGPSDDDVAAHLVDVQPQTHQSAAMNATALREAVADFFATHHTDLLKYWCRDVRSVHALERRMPCLVCGRRTISRHYTIGYRGVTSRRHTHCPNCGPVQDTAIGRQISLVPQEDRGFRWLGYRPRLGWSARLVVEPQLNAFRMVWPWPAESDGSPMVEFCPPDALPPLPVRIALLAFWGRGDFAASGFLSRESRC